MPFEMKHFQKALDRSIHIFEKISRDTKTPIDTYNSILSMLNQALDNETSFVINDKRYAKFTCYAISSDRYILGDLFESERFEELIDLVLSKSDKLIKGLLVLYYRKFELFNKEENEYYRLVLIEQIKKNLRSFGGRSKMVLKAKEYSEEILSANFHLLLKKYDQKNINDIRKDLYLNEQDDFYIKLRLIKLLEEIQILNIGEYNENLFGQIFANKEKKANNKRLIGEECVYILLDMCRNTNSKIPQKWIDFILKCVGDPRSPSIHTHSAWSRIGTDLKDWVVSVLSKGDLIEFLEGITDGCEDEIYKYRKAFWLQYVNYVRFAKIMVGRKGEDKIRQFNQTFYSRFLSNPTTYSRLKETQRSCIYMDFGDLKVIEGTHNASIRLYSDCPINLNKKEYNYTDFYSTDLARKNLVWRKNHHGSSEYSWQNYIRNELKERLGINIKLKDIMLPEDTKNLIYIANDLYRNGHIVK